MAARRPNDPDAIVLLAAHHRSMRGLFRAFRRLARGDADRRRELVEFACTELKVHAALEEELLYPAARGVLGADGAMLLDEAEIEHGAVQDLVAQLGRLPPADTRYAATFIVLAAYVDRHFKTEQTRLFPRLRAARVDLAQLALLMRRRKEALTDGVDTPGQVEPSGAAQGDDEPRLDHVGALVGRARRADA